MAAIYTVFTSPNHDLVPGHLPTLIVTPHGKPQQVLYSYLHTEENRVNYLLTPSPQGDLCVAKLFPPTRAGSLPMSTTASAPALGSKNPPAKVVRCEASRDLRWTIENTGIMSPIYKIVNQDDTPLYQISKPNPNAEFWTMFYFKYAGHQIPPQRIEFGRISKNPPEKGGGTRISITGKTEDEKMVWQTLGVGNEDCVEWVVCCACLNLLDDQIMQQAEKNGGARPGAGAGGPASTAAGPSGSRPIAPPLSRAPASTGSRPVGPGPGAGIASSSSAPPSGRPIGPGIASTAPPAANLAQTYRRDPALVSRVPPSGPGGYRQPVGGAPGPSRPMQPAANGSRAAPPGPMQFANGYDPRSRAPPPPMQNARQQQPPPPPQHYQPPSQQMQQQQQQQYQPSRNGMGPRGPSAPNGRRF